MILLMEHPHSMIMDYQRYPLFILSFTGLSLFLMEVIICFVVYLNQRKIEFLFKVVLMISLVINSVFRSMMIVLSILGLFLLHIQAHLKSFKVFMWINLQQEAFRSNGYRVVQRFDLSILNGKKQALLCIHLSLLLLCHMD